MRVLVLHTQIPFVTGGAEVLAHGLVGALVERGHEAEIVALPLQWNPPERLLDTALAWRMLDLTSVNGRAVDAVICTKFPTWAVRHPNKVLWLVHQHRQAYDLHGTTHTEFGPQHGEIRDAVFRIDGVGIGECKRQFAISKNVASRLAEFNGLDAAALYPPVQDRDLYAEAYEPFVLSASRIDPLKRIGAVVDAWPQVDKSLTLKITSDGPERGVLEARVRELGIEQRVEFLGRVSDAALADLMRRCRAVFFAPIDEDYGYVAVEALAAGKPVVTAPDSGGVLEFVEHEVSGQVTALTPAALAQAINRYVDAGIAQRHGETGQRSTRGLTWDNVVEALLGPAGEVGR